MHSALPRESVLVVRREVLDEFIHLNKPSKPSQQTGTSSKDAHPRERNTLLLIIAALLKEAKFEELSPYKAAQSIEAAITDMGVDENRDPETIAKKLELSRQFVEEHRTKRKDSGKVL